jgi:molybdate transport system permease protein
MASRAATDRSAAFAVSLLAVAFAAFFLLPFAGLIQRAVEDGNTWTLLRTTEVRQALILSLWTSTLTVAIAIAFGTPAAYILARFRFPGSRVVDALVDLPIVLPPTVAGVALLTAFGRRGLVGEPLASWTGVTLGLTTAAVVMAQLLVAAPFYVRAARSGFESVDPQVEQIAYTLGASRLRTFFRVTLPQAWPPLMAGIALAWARAMGELGATLIFAGNFAGKTQTMPLAIIQAFEGGPLGLAGAVAMSLILLAAALVVLVFVRTVAARILRV